MIDHDLAPARVLITGSVTWTDATMIEDALTELHGRRTEGSFRVLTGMADGADEIARRWAEANDVPCMADALDVGDYPRPMHNYNHQMLTWGPELVLAFKDNFDLDWQSGLCFAGTEHMCRIAAQAGVPVLLNGASWLDMETVQATEEEPSAHYNRWGDTIITVAKGDITTHEVDVVVNAANSSLLGGGGVDGAIHRAAGPELLDACREVVARQGGCDPGEAVITRGGALADHVVHTVGPVWTGDEPDHTDQLLARCYTESLRLAAEAGATSIAFPNISTGVYRYPVDRAARVTIAAVKTWLAQQPHEIGDLRFVCFTEDNFDLYADIISPR